MPNIHPSSDIKRDTGDVNTMVNEGSVVVSAVPSRAVVVEIQQK